ncbi:hypothetical protein LAV79_05310 [Peribacillus butanolivorans]|uniref:hypothetical protein n=1 Tax=Peribacillus butanolivorans TaxID=421767 RepID=UPI0030C9369E
MNDIFDEIERGLDAGVYQLSLSMALCIPDICAALESDDGKTNGRKYRSWYEKYVGNVLRLSSSDCYFFRCSFLHQGSTEHENSKFKKIIFIEPNHGIVGHNNVMDDVLNIDVRIFCKDMINAGRKWYATVKDSDNFKKNHDKTFKRYPNGLSPYIVGVPVYA